MRLLFAKPSLAWPRSSGHDVHTFHMMKACAALGHEVSLATVRPPAPEAIDGVPLSAQFVLDADSPGSVQGGAAIRSTELQRRFRDYYGVPARRISALARAASETRADAVIVVGLDVLPFFPALSNTVRVWYAADEWVWHHLSQLRPGAPEFGVNLRDAITKGLYERAHAGVIDRTWVVSNTERRAMRWLGGARSIDEVPNGVDTDYYTPGDELEEPGTAVFWGRLDFGPNIQALEWFCRRVWPRVRAQAPDARFTIVGFKPSDRVRVLGRLEGVTLVPDLGDLRPAVRRHALVVLPFVSGGGIKNKLLEAAAMRKAIVCTGRVVRGLNGDPPVRIARTPREWASTMLDAWADPVARQALGRAARQWVLREHTWESAAHAALASIERHVNGNGN